MNSETNQFHTYIPNLPKLTGTYTGLPKHQKTDSTINWASEASPTLGCSIEISRDIYVVGMSVVCQINCVGGITWPTRMLKVFWEAKQ